MLEPQKTDIQSKSLKKTLITTEYSPLLYTLWSAENYEKWYFPMYAHAFLKRSLTAAGINMFTNC